MAIFTSKADQSLPLLTQLYQLEENEIDEWVELWNQRNTGSVIRVSKDDDHHRFAGLLSLIKTVMNALSDGVHPENSAQTALNRWVGEELAPPVVVWRIDSLTDQNVATDERFRRGRAEVRYIPTNETLTQPASMRIMYARILVALLRLIEHGECKRCEECKSSFPVTKAGQRYCSQRCRSRVGERRRYAVKMEGYPARYKKRG